MRLIGSTRVQLVMLLMMLSSGLSAQWKQSVFFTSGEAALVAKSQEQLSEFIFARDVSKIDSVYILGYTDSTGQHKKNERLALKRTKRTTQFIRPLFSDTLKIVSKAMGEESERLNPGVNHRRVEVILYSKEAIPVVIEPEEPVDTLSKDCFRRNDDFMALCQWIYPAKASVKTLKLALEPHLYNENLEVFTLSTRSKNPKQLRWHKENTGKLWWKHERWYAEVKKADIEAFGLLTKVTNREDSTQCYVCTNTPIKRLETEIRVVPDVAIMQNLQLRKKGIDDEVVLIVPEEFVRTDRSYFADEERTVAIQWYAMRGKRNFPYYFAKVPKRLVAAEDWSVRSYQEVCETRTSALGPQYGTQEIKKHRTSFEAVAGFLPYTFGAYTSISLDTAFQTHFGLFAIRNFGKKEVQLNLGFQHRNAAELQVDVRYHLWTKTAFQEYGVVHTNRPAVDDFQRSFGSYVGGSVGLNYQQQTTWQASAYAGVMYHHNAFFFGIDRLFIEIGPGFQSLNASFQLWNRCGMLWRF